MEVAMTASEEQFRHRFYEVIQADHARLRERFSALGEEPHDDRKVELLDQLHAEMDMYLHLGENVLWSTLCPRPDVAEVTESLRDDQEEIRDLLDEIRDLPIHSRGWMECYDRLKAIALNHFLILEETLFPAVKECLEGKDLEEIAHDYEKQKVAYIGGIGSLRTAKRQGMGCHH